MSNIFDYLSIATYSEGLYTEKGSKFIACVYPVSNEAEVKLALESTKKKYPKAVHYCYAYQLGGDKTIFRANDDGEPSGTAGKPIHGQIRSHNLSDVLIVVVRYFGGTLLGASGLIHAYKTAAAAALINSTIFTKTLMETAHFSFYFTELNDIMKIAKQKDVSIVQKQIQSECTMALSFPKELEVKIRKQLDKVTGLRFL
jgi:uncharacterized YigZ family protein